MNTKLIKQVKLGSVGCKRLMLNSLQVWPFVESETVPPEFDIDYGPSPELTFSSGLVFTTYGETVIYFETLNEASSSTSPWYGGVNYTLDLSTAPSDTSKWSSLNTYYSSDISKWRTNSITFTKDKPLYIVFNSYEPINNIHLKAYGDPFYVAGTLGNTTGNLDYNYLGLFSYCTLLQTANINFKGSLGNYAFASLFEGCTSLKAGPSNLSVYGYHYYHGMFYGCTSLVKAPILGYNTTYMAEGCYNELFYGCSSLKYIKTLFLHEPSSYCTLNWVYGISTDGIFVKNKGAAWDSRGTSYIPEGWTIQTE